MALIALAACGINDDSGPEYPAGIRLKQNTATEGDTVQVTLGRGLTARNAGPDVSVMLVDTLLNVAGLGFGDYDPTEGAQVEVTINSDVLTSDYMPVVMFCDDPGCTSINSLYIISRPWDEYYTVRSGIIGPWGHDMATAYPVPVLRIDQATYTPITTESDEAGRPQLTAAPVIAAASATGGGILGASLQTDADTSQATVLLVNPTEFKMYGYGYFWSPAAVADIDLDIEVSPYIDVSETAYARVELCGSQRCVSYTPLYWNRTGSIVYTVPNDQDFQVPVTGLSVPQVQLNPLVTQPALANVALTGLPQVEVDGVQAAPGSKVTFTRSAPPESFLVSYPVTPEAGYVQTWLISDKLTFHWSRFVVSGELTQSVDFVQDIAQAAAGDYQLAFAVSTTDRFVTHWYFPGGEGTYVQTTTTTGQIPD
ncbi:MAG: hypothetical protein OEZ59_08490, partial [Deltaproteobacteria bacterium]|nr:hypothetical protein [Deltaproteobacteria bacterium]